MKYKLHTKRNRLFHGGEIELDEDDILTNDVRLPGELNCHNTQLWVIGHAFGPICAVWADCEQDALDEACDKDRLGCFLIDEDDQAKATDDDRQEWTYLGNASEPANLDDCWMAEVVLDNVRDFALLLKLAEAKGACADNLGQV